MIQTYPTLRVAVAEDGVLSVVIDAPPTNLIGPELVRNRVAGRRSQPGQRAIVPVLTGTAGHRPGWARAVTR